MYHARLGRFISRDPDGVPILPSVRDEQSLKGLGGLPFTTTAHIPLPLRRQLERYGDGMNLYEYCRSGPAIYLDPYGNTCTCPAWWGWRVMFLAVVPKGWPVCNAARARAGATQLLSTKLDCVPTAGTGRIASWCCRNLFTCTHEWLYRCMRVRVRHYPIRRRGYILVWAYRWVGVGRRIINRCPKWP